MRGTRGGVLGAAWQAADAKALLGKELCARWRYLLRLIGYCYWSVPVSHKAGLPSWLRQLWRPTNKQCCCTVWLHEGSC